MGSLFNDIQHAAKQEISGLSKIKLHCWPSKRENDVFFVGVFKNENRNNNLKLLLTALDMYIIYPHPD